MHKIIKYILNQFEHFMLKHGLKQKQWIFNFREVIRGNQEGTELEMRSLEKLESKIC
jgi:hypothetical protein